MHQTRTVLAVWAASPPTFRIAVLLALAAQPWGQEASASVAAAGGELALKGTADYEYDSNIFGNEQEIGAWHAILTPETVFVREGGLLRVEFGGGVKRHLFREHHELDSWDPFYRGEVVWEEPTIRNSARLDASLARNNEANPDVNTRTRSDDLRVSGRFHHYPGDKLGYAINGVITERDFLTPGFSSLRTREANLEGRSQYTPKWDVLIGAGVRRSSTFNVPLGVQSVDSTDLKAFAGVEGDVFAKVDGRAVVGWVQRRFNPRWRESQPALLFDTALAWRPDDDTSITLKVIRDFDTSPLEESAMHMLSGIEARRQLRDKWTLVAELYHRDSTYEGRGGDRRDKSFISGLRLEYQLNRTFTAQTRASYLSTDSTRRISDYDRFVVGGAVRVTL